MEFLLGFGGLALLAVIAFMFRSRRDKDDLDRMADDEAADDAFGYGALDEFEVSHDPDSWRGDVHLDDGDDDDNERWRGDMH